MKDTEKQEVYDTFRERVNMSPSELEKWLDTEQSQTVGQDSGDGESKGHKSGKRIVEIKRTKKADLSEDDYAHMKKVNAYIGRHCAQKPQGDVEDSAWRHSLKNWGHDPLKS